MRRRNINHLVGLENSHSQEYFSGYGSNFEIVYPIAPKA